MAASFAHFSLTGLRRPQRHLQRLPKLYRHLSSAITENASPDTGIEKIPEYPPVKPKYPSGTWGSMNHKYAWQWQDLREKVLNIPDVQGRLTALQDKKTLAMIIQPKIEHRIHNFEERVESLIEESATAMMLEPLNNHPNTLQFRQYVTKTHFFPWEQIPERVFGNNNGELLDKIAIILQQHISDHIQMEYDIAERIGNSPSQKQLFTKSLIQCISENLITELGKYCNHLQNCQYDEDVTVRALWSRHGFERKIRKFMYDPDEKKYDKVQDQYMVSEGKFDAMLRSHLPLPEFEPQITDKSKELEPPTLMYKPWVYGQNKASKKPLKSLKSIVAGHRLGDPCEFGLIGFLSTCDTHKVEEEFNVKVAQDCRLAMGLTNTFTWLTAQACNQGFSHIIDLTYPLTSQTVLTDGRTFSFLAYQLNTLELWKDDDGNNTVNMCWHTEEMPLYHSIEEGKVREFNEDALKLLVQTFMLAPADRGYDMKPTISLKTEHLDSKQDFIPEKVIKEEVVEEEQYIVS